MNRGIALIGAASNLGIKTYDDGRPRRVHDAPAALRAARLGERLNVVHDAGDLFPENAYHQFERLPGEIHHEPEVARYCRGLAQRVTKPRRLRHTRRVPYRLRGPWRPPRLRSSR